MKVSLARCVSHLYMNAQKHYRESVRPDPAAASRLLAMADGVSIVLDYAERSATPRALWAAVLVTAVTSRKARDRFARTDGPKHALCTAHAAR